MWDKINVWQYQQIYNVIKTKDKNDTDLDTDVKLIAIVNNMTEMQIDSLPLNKYAELKETISFLNQPINGKAVKHIPISKSKRYKLNYEYFELLIRHSLIKIRHHLMIILRWCRIYFITSNDFI